MLVTSIAHSTVREGSSVNLSRVDLPQNNLVLSLWDFTDSTNWAVNQAFFTNGTVYMICFDLRNSIDHSNLSFWLSLVVSRAPLARIVLVGTHADDPLCNKERVEAMTRSLQDTLMDRMGNIRKLFVVSSTGGGGGNSNSSGGGGGGGGNGGGAGAGKGVRELLAGVVPMCVALHNGQGEDVCAATAGPSKLLRNISSRFRRSSVFKTSSASVDEDDRKSDVSPLRRTSPADASGARAVNRLERSSSNGGGAADKPDSNNNDESPSPHRKGSNFAMSPKNGSSNNVTASTSADAPAPGVGMKMVTSLGLLSPRGVSSPGSVISPRSGRRGSATSGVSPGAEVRPSKQSSFGELSRVSRQGSSGSVDGSRLVRQGSANGSDSARGSRHGSIGSPSEAPSMLRQRDEIRCSIPAAYVVFEEKLFALRAAVSPPVVTWAQFEALAAHSDLGGSDRVRSVAEYLQDTGAIVYFKGVVEQTQVYHQGSHAAAASVVENLIILDMRWLLRLCMQVVSWRRCTAGGRIKRRELLEAWDSTRDLSSEMRPAVFWLLEHFEVMFQVDEHYVFVPSLLEPSRVLTDEFWPLRAPAGTVQLSRFYTFDFLPIGFGARLMAQLMRLDWRPLSGWCNGMLLEKNKEVLLVEVNPSQYSLRVNVRASTGRSTTFGPLLECMSTLINDWLHCNVHVQVPCMHCLAAGYYDPYLFDLQELASLMADGDYFAYCRSIHPVRIRDMAPDVSVEGVSRVIAFNTVVVGDKLGDGSFSAVFRGRWSGTEVAVKMMNVDELDASHKTRVFSEWRREVETMQSLVHPNIVAMCGVCLEPFCMLLELCE